MQIYEMKTQVQALADLPRNRIVVGAKQLKKVLKAGQANQVYLASNADPAVTEPLESLCRQLQVAYVWVSDMKTLGSACGIEVGAAAAASVK